MSFNALHWFLIPLIRYMTKLDWLRGLLSNTKEELRETVAIVFGQVASALNKPDFEKAMRELGKGLKERSLEYQHGVLLALGHAFGRRLLLARIQNPAQKHKV